MSYTQDLGIKAKAAEPVIAGAGTKQKNEALAAISKALIANTELIIAENDKDIRFAQEISIPARRARSEERSVLRYSSTERGEATQQGAKSTSERYVIQYPVTIAERIHLYPSRTQKLSSPAQKILGGRLPGKI